MNRPASVTDMRVNLVGLASMVAMSAWLIRAPVDLVDAAGLVMAATLVPIALLDLVVHRVHRRPSTGLDWSAPRGPIRWGRVLTRWLGAAGAAGGVLVAYALTNEYHGTFYDPFYTFLWRWGPTGAVLSLVYLAWVDGRLAEPRDAYWQLGRVLLGRTEEVDLARLADLARTWVVKGFFTPLMFVFLTRAVNALRHDFATLPPDPMHWYDALIRFSFLVDLSFTTLGYLVTVRFLDSHVRSAQPTMTGWVVAILCYEPFWGLIGGQYIVYGNDLHWDQWLDPVPAVKVAWGVGLLLAATVFAGTTVAFGARFSNLTNRGVITGGFYRFTRHPAYVAKLTSYMMIAVPFVYRGSVYEVVHNCFWWSVLAWVYWMRARTEEAHLSEDPDYVRYALYMNENSVFAWVGRLFPALKYRPPPGVTVPDDVADLVAALGPRPGAGPTTR